MILRALIRPPAADPADPRPGGRRRWRPLRRLAVWMRWFALRVFVLMAVAGLGCGVGFLLRERERLEREQRLRVEPPEPVASPAAASVETAAGPTPGLRQDTRCMGGAKVGPRADGCSSRLAAADVDLQDCLAR